MKRIIISKSWGNLIMSSIITLFLVTSCNRETMQEEQSSQTKLENMHAKTTGEEYVDVALASESIRLDMVNFVDGIREYYSEGMTYQQLKETLDPEGQLSNITLEGDALLFEAYSNISNDVSNDEMSGEKMADALELILNNSLDSGITDIEEVDFESGSLQLFGLDESYSALNKSESCRWYQIGCHLRNFWNWLNSDANGDKPGTMTNLQVISAAVSTLAGILGLLDKF